MADHRPDVYEDQSASKLIFRASSITRCSKSLVAAALEMEPQPAPAVMQLAWDEGTAAEGHLLGRFCDGGAGWDAEGFQLDPAVKFKMLEVRALTSYKKGGDSDESFPYMHWSKIDDDQFTFEIPVGEKAVVRGHMDGICEVFQVPSSEPGVGVVDCPPMHERAVTEAKFFGVDYFKKYLKVGLLGAEGNGSEPFLDYAWQLSLYMHATGLPAYFIVGEKLRWSKMDDAAAAKAAEKFIETTGREAGVDEQWDVGRLHVTRFNAPLISLPKIKLRVMKLVKLIEARELGGCDRDQYPCAYSFLHDGGSERVVEVTGQESGPKPIKITDAKIVGTVVALARQYKELTASETAAKEKKKQIAARLDELLPRAEGAEPGSAGLWEVGGVKVEWVHTFTPGTTKTVTTKDTTRSFPKVTLPKKVEG